MAIKHTDIAARDLTDGDVLRIGSSTNYVLVHSAEHSPSGVDVTVYNGDVPNPDGATLNFDAAERVSLSMRGARP